jgi:tripartite-type tricarboxylate transporter receptor subunit TctC
MGRRILLLDAIAIGFVFACLAPPPAAAEGWPTRAMTMVVPVSAGGSADAIARVLAAGLSEVLGQPVIVENVTGAGGTTGANRVAKAAPDGYQFLFGTTGTFAFSQAIYRRPPYKTLADFTPVALVSQQPILLVVRKDLPVKTLQEFVAYAKSNQARMQYGSPGVGSGNHLGCVVLNAAIGVDVMHIPYRGGGPAMQDLIAGRNDYQCVNNVLAKPLIESGAIRAIAVLAHERSALLPDLASAQEQGFADIDVSNWFALALPKAAPAALVQKLNAAAIAAMNRPDVQEKMKKIGADLVTPDRRSSEYLQSFFASEIAKWGKVIAAGGVVID